MKTQQSNKPISWFLNIAVRWHGLIGGGVAGVVTSLIYSITGDKISVTLALGVVCLFCLGGFMLGLFFEHYNPYKHGNVHSAQFIVICSLAGAFVVAVLGAFAAKILTDDCFAAVRLGKSPVENCREFIGNVVLVSGCEVLAISVSAGCFCIQMRRNRRPWLRSLITATLIASFISCGIIVVFGMLDIGTRYFDIDKYPTVNPQTVLVGGAILGAALGLLVGLHASLMIAFAPEQRSSKIVQRHDADSPEDFDVFLSHNSKDKEIVRRLAEALSARGIKVWLDEQELIPGQPWQEGLEFTIQKSKSAAVLIGADGFGPWEIPEMRACLSEFISRQLPVIPVLLPNAPTEPELPLFLKQFTWVDLRDGLTDEGLERLIWGVTGKKS